SRLCAGGIAQRFYANIRGDAIVGSIRAGPLARPRQSLLVFDFFVVRIDYVFFRAAFAIPALRATLRARAILWTGARLRSCPCLGLAVHRLRQFVRRVGERLGRAVNLAGVLGLELGPGFRERVLDLLASRLVNFGAVLLERLLSRIDQVVELVARLGLLTASVVVGGMRLGLAHHLLDLFLVESGRRGYLDRLLLVGAQVLGMHVDDTVRIDVEGDLDLRQPARGRWDSDQVELAEQLVVRRHLALALEDANRDRGLIVLRGREHLALARGDGRVLLDQLGEHAA